MNWLSLIQLIPMTIIGIQQIHKDAGTPGTTKKQLVMESLGLAGVVATNTLTGNNAVMANQVASLASTLIDQFTDIFKKNSMYGFTPTPVQTTGVVVNSPNVPVATGQAAK